MNDSHLKAFRTLQYALCHAPVLSPPNFKYRMHVASDASAYGIGGIIYQVIHDKIYYISFAARSLSKNQVAYSTNRREILGCIYLFTKFRHWLYLRKFTLHVDHRSLIYINTQPVLNSMLLSWHETIQEFDFYIVHVKGIANIIPDVLSRLFEPVEESLSSPHFNPTMTNVFMSQINNGAITPEGGNVIIDKQRKQNTFYKNKSKNLLKAEDALAEIEQSLAAKDNAYKEHEAKIKNTQLIIRKSELADYMTPPEEERSNIIKTHHELGHYGINAIETAIHNDLLHWKNLREDIKNEIASCQRCLAFNMSKHVSYLLLVAKREFTRKIKTMKLS
jgi:hypothetical protein